MPGAARSSYPLLMLLCSGLLSLADTKESLCPKPVVSQNSLVVPLLSNASLTCPGCEGLVSWRKNEKTLRSVKEVPDLLSLVRYEDEDNYTCFAHAHPVCTVQLLVTEDLETPEFECYRRHPTSDIICEWTLKKMHPPSTQTVLIIQQGLNNPPERWPCAYTDSSKKVTCHAKHEEALSATKLFVSMCVTSQTSSASSRFLTTTSKKLLLPDPPSHVTVSPLAGAPRKLNVSWALPELWESSLYVLRFQVRYWAEDSRHVSNVFTSESHFLIEDAIMRRSHSVKVRAQEQFGRDAWSVWSEEATGTPWTGPLTSFATQDPSESRITFYTSSEELTSEELEEGTDNPPSAVRRYTLLVVGVNLGLFTLLFLGIILRMQWKLNGCQLKDLFLTFFDGSRTETTEQSNGPLLLKTCGAQTPGESCPSVDATN